MLAPRAAPRSRRFEFDRRFRERFLRLHEAAAGGELDGWNETPATDAAARKLAAAAVAAGDDRFVAADLQKFFYLPFGHSEDLADQDRAVELSGGLGGRDLEQAQHHRDSVRRFGRSRIATPSSTTTPQEAEYLAHGGYTG